MIITVITQFPALMKDHISKILEPLYIILAFRPSVCFVLIIFYYNSCILHIVSRSKGDHIRPPDIGIEIRNTGAIIPFYISSISIWNWGGKIIQIKDGSVDHRIYPHICKKTIGCSKKASESFFIKPKIIYYKLSVSIISFPDQRNA